MKALIVDDEHHVITAIRLLADWKRFNINEVYEASSALEAIKIFRSERPQIIITDIVMPDQTGLDFMEILHQEYPDVKVIVVSGHSNFDYVRATLKYGGIDYLLKPIGGEALNSALQKACDLFEKEASEEIHKQKTQSYLVNLSNICQEMILSRILTNPAKYCSDLTNLTQVPAHIPTCRIAYLSMQHLSGSNGNVSFPAADEIAKELNAALLQQKAGTAFSNSQNKNECIILLWNCSKDGLQILSDSILALSGQLKIYLSFGVSARVDFPQMVPEAYAQAKTAFESIDLLKPAGILCEKIIPPDNGDMESVAFPEEEMLSAILSGDDVKIRKASAGILNRFIFEGYLTIKNFILCVEHYQKIYAKLITHFTSTHPSFLHEISYRPLDCPIAFDANGSFQLEHLQKLLATDMQKLSDELAQAKHRGTAIIHQITQDIKTHYDKEFSQSEYARRYFLSKEYMCRKFKEENGVSMVNYLNAIRISRSKLLLIDPDLKISDIAHQVGYPNEKYYSRMFKRFERQSPTQFRASGILEGNTAGTPNTNGP